MLVGCGCKPENHSTTVPCHLKLQCTKSDVWNGFDIPLGICTKTTCYLMGVLAHNQIWLCYHSNHAGPLATMYADSSISPKIGYSGTPYSDGLYFRFFSTNTSFQHIKLLGDTFFSHFIGKNITFLIPVSSWSNFVRYMNNKILLRICINRACCSLRGFYYRTYILP